MAILVYFILYYILLSISLFFLFPKAGVAGWKGLVPGLNFVEWCKIIGRPKWYALWLLVPIVAFFMIAGMCVALAKSFGRNGLGEAALAVIYAPLLFFKYAFDSKIQYQNKAVEVEHNYLAEVKEAQKSKNEKKLTKLLKTHPYPKSGGREWLESIFFAVFAAAFIRMFFIEAYVIPTPSMEGSLNVGDYLFVSKAHYGIRTPQTILMVPLLHNRLPIIGRESYISKPNLPYFRLKALKNIERNDKIVFNWPVGDSVYITKSRSYSVAMLDREPIYFEIDPELRRMVDKKAFVVRPVDKKDHYIKRCVGIAGDTLQVIDGEVWINGVKSPRPKHMQFLYLISFPGQQQFNRSRFPEWGIDQSDYWQNRYGQEGYFLDDEQVAKIKSLDPNIQLIKSVNSPDPIKLFPHDPTHFPNWSVDNYGPIWIPKKGVTIDINASNIALYQRVIGVYEQNDLRIENGAIMINGVLATTYTFKQDYYWGMGDNRHNSEDSRSWGFVPHDHIVGEPLFIWFSAKDGNPLKGIHWNRIFTSARNK